MSRVLRGAVGFIGAICAFGSVGRCSADDWPEWMGPHRDDVWRETGIVDKFPASGPKLKWRVPVGVGYAGPAVALGRVYVFDYLPSGEFTNDPATRSDVEGVERLHCLNAADGKPLWDQQYDCRYRISYPGGPRCTPTVADGKVYTLGAEGRLSCFDANTGAVVWRRDLKTDYEIETPEWGFCGHPLVDGRKLICLVGSRQTNRTPHFKGSVVVAFDKDSGKELWRALDAPDPGYSPPTMIQAGKTKQLIIWHSEKICSLNPETGGVYWEAPLKPSYKMSIMAPRLSGDYLFAGGIIETALVLKLGRDKPTATEVWRGSKGTGVFPVCGTPFAEDGVVYGVCSRGELRAVELATGKRLWEDLQPITGGKRLNSASAFLIKNGDRFFLAAENGDLVIARLSPQGYQEISRCKLIEPTGSTWGRSIVWSHPAFANRCVFARNDKELVCASLAAE